MEKEADLTGILAVVDDLMFASKIDGLAHAHGVPCLRVKSAGELDAALASPPRAIVFVSLGLRGMDSIAAISRIKKEPAWAKVAVLAFGSHVEVDKFTAARAAGANGAMANSEFTRLLPDLIKTARSGDKV